MQYIFFYASTKDFFEATGEAYLLYKDKRIKSTTILSELAHIFFLYTFKNLILNFI